MENTTVLCCATHFLRGPKFEPRHKAIYRVGDQNGALRIISRCTGTRRGGCRRSGPIAQNQLGKLWIITGTSSSAGNWKCPQVVVQWRGYALRLHNVKSMNFPSVLLSNTLWGTYSATSPIHKWGLKIAEKGRHFGVDRTYLHLYFIISMWTTIAGLQKLHILEKRLWMLEM